MENNKQQELTSLNEIFKNMCRTGAKKYEHRCQYCNKVDIVYRRDLTWQLTTFLLGLRDLMIQSSEEYQNYNNVLQYCRKQFKTNPTDYSLLETKWNLIQGWDNKNGQRLKTLTDAGYYFLNNELAVSTYHYQVPDNGRTLWSKKKVGLDEILYLSKTLVKELNEPFFSNNIEP